MLTQKEWKIRLNLYGAAQTLPFEVVQNDVESNKLTIQLYSNRTPYDLTNITQVHIVFEKKDGNVVQGDCVVKDVANGIVEYEMGTNEIAVPGKVLATVYVTENGSRLSFNQFTFTVRKDLINDTVIQSTTEYQTFVKLTDEMIVLKENVNSAESSRNASESARNSAEALRISGEDTRVGNEQTRATNEQNRATTFATWQTQMAQITDKIKTATYTASGTVTNIVHNLPYSPTTDDLLVIYKGVLLERGSNYNDNANNISIDLIGWSLSNGEKMYFKLYKNVR